MASFSNIPLQLTSFVGRKREIEEVKRLLSTTRLLTLTGAGGSGKTRLSIQVASELINEYPDGVWFVELAALDDPSLIPQSLASALFISEQPKGTLLSQVTTYLNPLKLLLVLDNCEHLAGACSILVDGLLRACHDLTILTTTRQPLGLDYEITWRVPPLSVPAPGDEQFHGNASQYEAIQLFVERARLKQTDFTLTPGNLTDVAKLCSRLDGLPLAIELAAARVNVLSVNQILRKMEQPFRLLKNSSPMAPPRQQTLQAAIDWSFQLLTPSEQLLFRVLGIFAGSFSLEAAIAICGGEIDEYEVMDLVASLVDKSLLVVDEQSAEPRYRLLETIRDYSRDKLALSGEMPHAQRRFFKWYRDLAEQAEPELQASSQLVWLDLLEAELDNIRATIRLASELGDVETAGRTTAALWWFWCLRGYISEGRGWNEHVAALPWDEEHRAVRAKLLLSTGIVATIGGDMHAARAYLEESISLQDSHTKARITAYSKGNLSFVLRLLGDPSGESLMEESLVQIRRAGDQWALAMQLNSEAEIALLRRNYKLALTSAQEGLQAAEEVGDRWLIADSLRILGRVSFQERDYKKAAHYYTGSLRLAWTLGRTPSTALGLAAMASFAADQEQPVRAARLFGAAQTLLDARGAAFQPQDQQEIDRHIESARAELDSAAWEAAWAEGQDMQLEQLVQYALEQEDNKPSIPTSTPDNGEVLIMPAIPLATPNNLPDGLTEREVEVLRLVTSGQTVRQVAEQLCLSAWTVQAHIRSIYSKIGVTSRSAATRYVVAHNLI
ncbi:MAG: LuxR C-terminal-related transcriptional regulator [Chloroflexia bacterium]